MKKFTEYLKEEAEGQEFVVKILVRGVDGKEFDQCHKQCVWLGKTEEGNKPFCKLFGNELKETEGDLEPTAIRSEKCKNCTSRLI